MRSRNHFCSGKAINIAYSDCVYLTFFIQHQKRMRYIILPSMACPDVLYFSTLSHKRHDFVVKSLNIKFVFRHSLQRLPETFLILRMQRDIINLPMLVKYPLFLSEFNEIWIFSTDSRKSSQISNSMKFPPMLSEIFFNTTDEANNLFRNFVD